MVITIIGYITVAVVALVALRFALGWVLYKIGASK